VLPAVSALITRFDWDVPELHLESGRLDEVFRTLTGAAARRPMAPAPDNRSSDEGARP